MSAVSAQVSVYPLRRLSIGEPLEAVVSALRSGAVDVNPGPMSTIIIGTEGEVFGALEAGFRAACAGGDAVMVVTISNACPTPSAAGMIRGEARRAPPERAMEEE